MILSLTIALTGVLIGIAFFIMWRRTSLRNRELESKLSSQMKAIEERLAVADKYSRMLATVADKTFEAVIITDKEGIIEWVNEGFYKITGYSLAEVQGKKPGQVLQGKNTDPKTVDRIRQKLKEKVIFKDEILNYHKSGYEYWLSLSITPVLNAKGDVDKFIAIESDITKQKRELSDLEKKLRLLS